MSHYLELNMSHLIMEFMHLQSQLVLGWLTISLTRCSRYFWQIVSLPYSALLLYSYVTRTFKRLQSFVTCQGWGVCCHSYVNTALERTHVDHQDMPNQGSSTYTWRGNGCCQVWNLPKEMPMNVMPNIVPTTLKISDLIWDNICVSAYIV